MLHTVPPLGLVTKLEPFRGSEYPVPTNSHPIDEDVQHSKGITPGTMFYPKRQGRQHHGAP
ncbi:hypothetical protein GCM10023171_00100 [Microbacterium panaciterrae]|uniref:Uncharacterized protein n=1 Tax=Microbacterium panaciterrae TaxID=985759 RepID=A0ABP8P197_9MICO